MTAQALASMDASLIASFGLPRIATTLSFLVGVTMCIVSVLRCGIVLDLIAPHVILGFSSGAAFMIVFSQLPTFFGVTGLDTTNFTYRLPWTIVQRRADIRFPDAMCGLVSVAVLVLIQGFCHIYKDRYSTLVATLAATKHALVLAIASIATFIILSKNPSFTLTIVGDVPSGLPAPEVPYLGWDLVSSLSDRFILIAMVALLEQMAIAQSFGMHCMGNNV